MQIEYINKQYTEMLLYNNNGELVKKVLIDTEDVDRVSERTWHIRKDGRLYTTYYLGNRKRKNVLIHRYILNYSGDLEIDHISRDSDDNRKENLRIATSRENSCNTIKNKINIPGVKYISDRGYWVVQIKIDSKTYHIGAFRKLENAIIIRIKAEQILGYIINKDYYHMLENYPELKEINTIGQLKMFIEEKKYGWNGEEKRFKKLSPDDLKEIFKDKYENNMTNVEISKKFKVTSGHISDILNGRRGKSLIS